MSLNFRSQEFTDHKECSLSVGPLNVMNSLTLSVGRGAMGEGKKLTLFLRNAND